MVAQHEQRRVVELVAVQRRPVRDALPPADLAVGRREPEQQHVLLVLHPERRAERAYQRQPAPQHLDGLDPHACLP